MKYEIFGDNLPAVTIHLDNGESVYTQSGGMTWMSTELLMETNMKGGLMGGFKRMLMNESVFQATYTAKAEGQFFTAASTMPGNIVTLNAEDGPYICQKSAFLVAHSGVHLDMYVLPGLKTGIFGGDGFIFQEISGDGLVFLEIDGSVREIDLAPGQKLKVNTGNVAVFEKSVTFSVETVKGFKNILFGGEGLFLTTVEGPGKVWLQTMTAPAFAEKLVPYMPFKRNDS